MNNREKLAERLEQLRLIEEQLESARRAAQQMGVIIDIDGYGLHMEILSCEEQLMYQSEGVAV